MAETIDSLLVSLGMDADKKSFEQANNMIKGVRNNALQFAALAGTGWGLTAVATNLAKTVVSLNEMSKLIGVAPNDILRLEHAFGRLGLSANNAFSLLNKARDWMYQANWGQLSDDMTRALHSVGISPQQLQNARDPVQTLDIVANAYNKMDGDNRLLFAGAAGVSNDERSFLSRPESWRKESYRQFDQRNGGVNQQAVLSSEALLSSVNNVKAVSGGLIDDMIITTMPRITSVLESLDGFLTSNRKEIVQQFEKALPLVEACALGIAALVAAKGIKSAGGALIGLMAANPLLSTTMGALLLSGDSGTSNMTPEEINRTQQYYAKFGAVNASNTSQVGAFGDMSTPEARRSAMLNRMNNPNVSAFLKAIRDHESGDSYNTIYGGGKFTDMSRHPGYQMDKKVTVPGYKPFHPSASGAYQITQGTYDDFAGLYGVKGFSKEDQDVLAMAILFGDGYLQKIEQGKFDEVLNDPRFGKRWASAPGSKEGQNPKSLNSWMKSINNAPVPSSFNLGSYAPSSNSRSSSITHNSPSMINHITINAASDKVEDTAKAVRQILYDLNKEAKVAQGRDWQ